MTFRNLLCHFVTHVNDFTVNLVRFHMKATISINSVEHMGYKFLIKLNKLDLYLMVKVYSINFSFLNLKIINIYSFILKIYKLP